MRKTTNTTNTTQQPATKRSKPAAQAQETAAHPASWTQLALGLNVLTWREEMKQKKKAK